MNKKIIGPILAIVSLKAIVFYSLVPRHAIPPADSHVESQPFSPDHANNLSHFSPIESPAYASTRDSTPNQNQDQEKPSSNENAWRSKLIERLEPVLQERLLSEGYSQYEIDATAKELVDEFNKHEGTIKYSEAVNRAAKVLNLDDEKKSRLNILVLKTIGQSVEITFEQWDQCLNDRVKNMSQCTQDIAQDLSRRVAAVTTGQPMTNEEWSMSMDLSRKAMADAVNRCGITADEADRALRVVLSDCP